MTSINWSKVRQNTSMKFNGSVDKATEREWREKDRAARWLETVEASKPPSKSNKRNKAAKRSDARETAQ